MATMKPDILFEIKYPMDNPEEFEMRTNAKTAAIEELLTDYIRASHMGKGKDPSEPEQRDEYEITLGFEVGTDSWGTNHNCGNKGLVAGIVMEILKRVNAGQVKGIKPFSDG